MTTEGTWAGGREEAFCRASALIAPLPLGTSIPVPMKRASLACIGTDRPTAIGQA